jgi:hypothetical protein
MDRFDALITDDGISAQLFDDFNSEGVTVLVANAGREGLRASVS